VSPIRRPTRDETLVFATSSDLRAWLAANHGTAGEAWIGFYRKGVPKTSVTYDEAVDQALCFGWIDGITYRVDDEVTAIRFTPRRKGSNWSAANVGRAERLTEQGLMTPAGLVAYALRDASADARRAYERRPADLPPELLGHVRADPAARAYWEGETPGYRRTVAYWVTSAKREETRRRRLAQLIEDAAAGRRIASLSSGRDGEGAS
jgi:uncharacterized protein YdeI (YjbR/CyaY-like superfamily)